MTELQEEIIAEDKEEELPPLKVEVTNKETPKENPTSWDTKDEYDYIPSDEEIKEMTDAQ